MVVATMLGVVFASLRLDILVMLVFVGALWGAIVFPVIISFYWNRVTNRAFTTSVMCAVVLFTLVRFELVPLTGAIGVFFELIAAIGAAVVIGLMIFAFLPRQVAFVGAAIVGALCAYYFVGFLRDYVVLLSALTSYGVSAFVCVLMSFRSSERFDFSVLAERVTAFNEEREVIMKPSKTQS